MMRRTGIVILAAGASQRLGTPKQQVRFEQQSLLKRIIHTAQQTSARPIVVVLGAFADNILPETTNSEAIVIINPHWETGMGSSIQAGVQHLLHIANNVSDVLILLCDQPFITAALLEELITTHLRENKGITACTYGNTTGTPIIFHQKYFPLLQTLSGQEGAKKIIYQHPDDVTTLPFPEGSIDIDTPEDLKKLHI
ncbi:nucleotidyltransferase family protein [Chitinophaga qingshengii]|uniref:Nucleotidyltransferase family protein n=1 Tax=Chitinophaga qingshengii TaxID=1569794 RepID=A0ABR7TTR2_9BACT|nr:nucleotidyltransferase family protein [Chitinophaga qingshengii]MBC9932364.1 nucleotidyltransferase family protein [Chitinophaga qingshengii]